MPTTTDPWLTSALLVCALAIALSMRPWRLLRGGALLHPWLGSLVLLPWLWALPSLHAMPLQLQWSGANLVLLMLGWPLAVPTLILIAALAGLAVGMPLFDIQAMALWQGVLPATLALLLGAVIRRWIGPHLFVYVLGRAFLSTAACNFAAMALAQWSGHNLPGVSEELSLVAHWLMAWGDGFMTGMLAAVFVAFKPHWLATWSDKLYLPPPRTPPRH